MDTQDDRVYDRLLLEWHIKHEMVHFYSTALLRLAPSDPSAERRRRELSAKVSIAVIGLTQVSDQLQAHELRRAPACLAQP